MKYLISLLFISLTLTITAQPGTLDNSFGTSGKVIENTGAPYIEVIDEVIQTDGKTIVLADAEYNHTLHIVLIRYNTNGTFDNTFSGDGIADAPFAGPADPEYPDAIKLQADGKILVCGGASDDVNPPAFVARYNTNGTLDNTFGSTGIVYIQDPNIYEINNLVVLPNSQLVLLCSRWNDTTYYDELALVKLNSNGSLNGSFGTAGIATINTAEYASPTYTKIEVLSNGKFIVSGTRNASGYGYDDSVMIVRVNTNGTIDNTFATNGILSFDPGPASYHQFADMAIQSDGKIIVSGNGSNNNNFSYTYITRIGTNGVKDNTFGTGGTQYIYAAPTGFASTGQIGLQADGKVIIGGFAKNTLGNYTLSAARLTTAGVLDAGFDGDGIALLQVNNYNSYGIAPLQQPDGKIVIAGYAGNGYAFSATIGRFTATGQTDNTISSGSTAIAYIGSGTSDDEGRNILVQTDQKIINVRERSNGLTYNIALSRHLPNGSLDNSFGLNGRAVIDLPGYSENTFAALLSNGKIVTVVDFDEAVAGGKIGLVRFSANGFPDTSFGLNGKLLFNTNNNEANRVIDAAIQPDGKMVILTSQYVDNYQNYDTTLLVRLNADGSYDNTFNGTGKQLLSAYPNANYTHLLVQADGKILWQRIDYTGSNGAHTLITRLNVNGTADASFNGGNAVDAPLEVAVTALQANGKIVLAAANGKLVRLNSNGTFDASFDGDGIVEPDYYFETGEGLRDIKIQTDGKILLSGIAYDFTSVGSQYQVVRINTNGTADSSFGTVGVAMITVVADKYNTCEAMALQADGKILLTGYIENQDLYYNDFAMIRLNGSNVGPTYTFTGNGAWNDPANWSNNTIPPATLPSGSTILIDPVAGGECLLSTVQHISAGATFTVKAGKKFKIAGGLILQ